MPFKSVFRFLSNKGWPVGGSGSVVITPNDQKWHRAELVPGPRCDGAMQDKYRYNTLQQSLGHPVPARGPTNSAAINHTLRSPTAKPGPPAHYATIAARRTGQNDHGARPIAAPLAKPEPWIDADKPAFDSRQHSTQATGKLSSEQGALGNSNIYEYVPKHHRSIRFADEDADETYYDDDTGVMSEAETSSTVGASSYVRRRQAHIADKTNAANRMAPPPSFDRTMVSLMPGGSSPCLQPAHMEARYLERANGYPVSIGPGRKAGVVFLQYQGETKRAVLPVDPNGHSRSALNSLDDVRVLFMKAFQDELPLEYLRSPNVKIYIQDSSKMDFFYELDDLNDVKDRSVLKLHESSTRPNSPPPPPTQPHSDIQLAAGRGTLGNGYVPYQRHQSAEDMNYFSEPEFDGKGDHRLQKSLSTSSYERPSGGYQRPDRMYSTLDRYGGYKTRGGGPPKPGRLFGPGGSASVRNSYSPPRTGEAAYGSSSEQDGSYNRGGYRDYVPSPSTDASMDALYQQRHGRISRSGSATPVIDEEARVRMINMEKQLANLSALVHSALMSKGVNETVYKDMEMLRREIFGGGPPSSSGTRDDASDSGSVSRFSDLSSDKGSYQSNPERDGTNSSSAPFSPPPVSDVLSPTRTTAPPIQPSAIHLTPEARHNLRTAKRRVTEVQGELKNLRRLAQLNAQCSRDILKDAFDRIKFLLNTNKHLHLFAAQAQHQNSVDANSISGDRKWIMQEEDRYLVETKRVERGLSSLEKEVEGLRQKVISGDRKLRMGEVESFTDSLTQIGRSAANLKNNFSVFENRTRNYMTTEMEKVVREEKFLKDEPVRLDNALKRCKKLASTMVTMKKLALVQDPSAYSTNSKRPPLPSKTTASGESETKSGAMSPPPVSSPIEQRRPLAPMKERTDHPLVNGGSARLAPSNLGGKDSTHPLDNLLEELQTAGKRNSGKSGVISGNGETLSSLTADKRVGFAERVNVMQRDLNESSESDTIKRSPKANQSDHSLTAVNSVLRTNLGPTSHSRTPLLVNCPPERRSASPSSMAASFRAAIPFLHGGKLGAHVRPGTPNSVASEPAIYRSRADHPVSLVPPPPPRSSSRNAVNLSPRGPDTASSTTTPAILSFRSEFEKKQRFFSGGQDKIGRETPIAMVQTNAVDDDARYVRSASSSESVNSQDGPGRRTAGGVEGIKSPPPPARRLDVLEQRQELNKHNQNRYVKFQLPDGRELGPG